MTRQTKVQKNSGYSCKNSMEERAMTNKGKPQSIDDPLRGIRGLAENITDPEDKLTTECMMVLISTLEVGADVDRLVKQTGYSRRLIEAISVRMRKAGLWIGELIDDTTWYDQQGGLTADFYSQALVAKGQLLREWTEDGRFRYLDAATGEVCQDWTNLDQDAADAQRFFRSIRN
jgi:hypothetical protein